MWYHNDLLLDRVGTLARNTTHFTLIIENVTHRDIGVYECVASNNIGDGRAKVKLSGKPYRYQMVEIDPYQTKIIYSELS